MTPIAATCLPKVLREELNRVHGQRGGGFGGLVITAGDREMRAEKVRRH